MKISNRLINNGIVCLCLLFLTSLSTHQAISQTLSSTDGTSNCGNCSPSNWVIVSGSPDISNDASGAVIPATGTPERGAGATWIVSPDDGTTTPTPLVLMSPPNTHNNWLSLRDMGPGNEESVSTSLGGLVAGRSYEIIVYHLTVVSDNDGYRNPGNPTAYYSNVYNDFFRYQVGSGSIQNVSTSINSPWTTSKISFVANGVTDTLIIYSGNNGAASNLNDDDAFETVQISFSENAINSVPVADNNIASTAGRTPVTFNVTSTDEDFGGAIDISTVDLDQGSAGIQNSITTVQGSWLVDDMGNVTFTAAQGFIGDATINYTVNDNFTLDGLNQSATSNSASLTVTVAADPSIEVTKTIRIVDNGNNILGINDQFIYTISVENNGNIPLTEVSIIDTFRDNFGGVLNFTSGPSFTSSSAGSPQGNLAVGETATYTARFTVTRAAVDAGGTDNTVQAFANSSLGAVSDISDDGDDSDGNLTDDNTITVILENPRIEAVKTFTIADDGNGVLSVDDIIIYTIAIRNRGNVTLNNITLEDELEDFLGNSRMYTDEPVFINANQNSAEGTLKVGEVATYNATYVITQDDVSAGGVRNSATAIANSPVGTEIRDVSDDNDDTDGDVLDDPTETPIPQFPAIEVTKTAVLNDNGDLIDGVDDTVTYNITIENTGNVFLENITWVDTFQNLDGLSIDYTTGITFVESDQSSPEGQLQVGETATYTATYTLTQPDVNSGGVSNSLEGIAFSLSGDEARDVSDDGIDTDGNITNDPTITEIISISEVEATKTFVVNDNGDMTVGVGDLIVYNITIENKGNVDLTITAISDILTDANGLPLNLTTGPTFLAASEGSDATTLKVGEIASYTATYLITQAAVDGGGVRNSFRVEAQNPEGNFINEVSDDGDDSDGNAIDDTTDTLIAANPSIEVTKEADLTDNGDSIVGIDDVVTYTISIENTGNVTISDINLIDTLTDLGGANLTLTSGPTFAGADMGSSEGFIKSGETASYTATYVLTQDDVNAGGISNTLTVEGLDPSDNLTSDISDDGDDTDGNIMDDPTVTLVAQDPSIEATKIATISDNGDEVLGVDDVVSYSILITNTGNVNLTNVSFTDVLAAINNDPRTLDTGPTFVSAGMGSSEGFLLVGETATYTATYVIEQRDVEAGGIKNQVFVEGESPLGVVVTDTSDDGDDLDGNTEDDPTVTVTPELPSLEVIKTASVNLGTDGELNAQDIITYTITVENTGNVKLDNVRITDELTDLLGNSLNLTTGPSFIAADLDSPEFTLLVGETATYLATYVLTQSDVDAGGVSNTVLGEGESPFGIDVDDTSDDGNPADTDGDGDGDNDPTVTIVVEDPELEVTKIADVTDNGDGALGAGDTINYTIFIENTGNVTLDNITITDNLTDLLGSDLTLNSGPTFSSSSEGSVEGVLIPGETATYTATYVLTQSDVDAAGVSNSVVVDAQSPNDTDISDTSDDGDDTDGNTTDDPTETLIPKIEITKTFTINDNGDNILGEDDEIEYTITVVNTGAIAVTGVTITDTVTTILGGARSLNSGPDFVNASQGSVEGSLLPGETATYSATYILILDDVIAGGISNTVSGLATSTDGDPANDTSDDGDDDDGNTEDDPTVTLIPEIVSLETTKTFTVNDNGDGVLGLGDEIEYSITVENTGNITVLNVSVDDTITDLLGNSRALASGPTFIGTNLLGIEGILLPGEIATYSATYIIVQGDIDAGGVSNSALASAQSPLGTDGDDTSDDGDDTDGNTEDDPTDTIIPEVVNLEVTKTASVFDDSDGIGVGDEITYTISVVNTGNVTVNGITIDDTLSDFTGSILTFDSPLTFDSSSSDNVEGTLSPGETATYTATYTITQSDVDAGGVSNTATASGTSTGGTPVDDISDDGDDTDGNTDDDPTDTPIAEVVGLEVTKTATVDDDTDGFQVGDIINYTITVENTGNVTINGVVISDTLTDFLGNVITPSPTTSFVSASLGSAAGTLQVGEIATYSASYTITQSDINAGGLSNSVIGNGTGAGGTPVDDISDDGDDTDGNTDDDPTETPIPEMLSMEITKTFIVNDSDGLLGAGDEIVYTIAVENNGNVTIRDIALIDVLSYFDGTIVDPAPVPVFQGADQGSAEGTLLPGEIATYSFTYIIEQAAVDAGGLSNTVNGSGEGDSGNPVDDTSDDGDDTDGNTDDDPTETPIPEDPRLEVTKTFVIDNLGSDVIGAGDIINYTIEIANTGNVTLSIDTITDTLQDFIGTSLNLTSDPIFDNATLNSPEGTLLPGESAFYLASYTITQADVDAGGVSNSVDVEASTGTGTDTDDTSDDGDDTDGNTEDDPTETPIPEVIAIEAIKTANVEDTNGDGFVGVGDIITYTITVQNVGNKNVTNISVTDTFTDFLGNLRNFDLDPGFTVFDLTPDESISFTATYTLTQEDVDAGGVSNTVLVSGEDEDRNPVDDVSDDGDPADSDGDGDGTNDPTDVPTDSGFNLSIDKVVDIQEPLIGDNVVFTITITNDGLVSATNISVTDLIPSGYEFVSSTVTAGSFSEINGVWSIDTLNPGELEMLEITVEVLGFGEYLNTATITDSDRGEDDDPSDDSDTADVDPICFTIYNEFSPNGDGVNDTFEIDCIENFPTSKLEIYNRWGNVVFETIGYRNDWDGTSNGRAVVDADGQLPVGTYYYVIDFMNGTEPRSGWLYINR